MKLYIVSDLHIYSAEDPIYRSLLSLIQDVLTSGDILVLAGDIFDLFVGDKQIFKDRYQLFFQALESASRSGAQIHYIEGNHDFQIQRALSKIKGISTHDAEVRLDLLGKKFFISHGDLAHQQDYPYRILRAVFRSLLFR